MAQEFTVITASVCNLNITTSHGGITTEKRFQKSITIADLKGRLELLTGVNNNSMRIELYDKTKNFITEINNDDALLGSYPVDDGMILHVIGKGPVDDIQLSKVEKLTLSEDEYSKRNDTVRAYLIRNRMGQYSEDATDSGSAAEKAKKAEEEDEHLAKSITIDSRCEVSLPGQPPKRGTVKYVGKVHFKPGYWIGVHYDEPLGKNDGSVEGKSYFKCPLKYGAFIKPQYVTVGDFPEEDIGLDDEM
ncbi:hypothetical protein CHUAL_003336 [Chamberlinius hualienensis]